MIHKFFAVTHSGSLYEVADENGQPVVKRIYGGRSKDFRLRGGVFVGIGHLGLCLFSPTSHHTRAFESMNVASWGGCTSGIVALFLEQDAAERCMISRDRTSLSPAFLQETQATLEAIGSEHPVFVIGESIKQFIELRTRFTESSTARQQ